MPLDGLGHHSWCKNTLGYFKQNLNARFMSFKRRVSSTLFESFQTVDGHDTIQVQYL